MANYLYLMDKLKGEYKEAFDKVYIYTKVRNMEGQTEQDMMMNLLDLMLVAQEEGKPVEKIVGNDIEKFCESYFEGYNYKIRIKDQVFQYINRVMWVVFIWGILELCYGIGESGFELLEEKTDISGYVLGIACGFGIILLNKICIKPLIFKWKKISSTIYDVVIFVMLILGVIGGCTILGEKEFNIPLFPTIIVSGMYIAIYKLLQAVIRYKKYGTIWKRKEPLRESWLSQIIENTNGQLPEELVKRYDKINKRRVRRGKNPMTQEEYMEKLRKENKQSDIVNIFAVIFIVIIVVGSTIDSMINESIVEGIILGVTLCIFEIAITIFFFKVAKNARIFWQNVKNKELRLLNMLKNKKMVRFKKYNYLKLTRAPLEVSCYIDAISVYYFFF